MSPKDEEEEAETVREIRNKFSFSRRQQQQLLATGRAGPFLSVWKWMPPFQTSAGRTQSRRKEILEAASCNLLA